MRKSRPGITLVEVLIAIFVMGIGLLAVLVLFPLGALNMARALKDDRCGSIAPNVEGLVGGFNLRVDGNVVDLNNTPATYNYYLNPVGSPVPIAVPRVAPNQFYPPDDNGPSYPVWIDPYFAITGLSTLGNPPPGYPLTGPSGSPMIPVARLSPTYATTINAATRWFSFLDDLYFDSNGLSTNFVLGPDLVRQGYYTYACMLRREKATQHYPVALTVIVYQGRPVQVPVAESAYFVQSGATNPPPSNLPDKADTSVILTWGAGQTAPDLRRGNWLFDATYYSATTALGTQYGYVNGKFYRVMEATISGANQMKVEIYPPIQDADPTKAPVNAALANVQPCMVVLDRAVEVFERGTGR
jgi:hypothetical protein